jgi:molecular chaperone HtpG
LELIGRHLGKKVTNELDDLRDNDREEYIAFFNEFGPSFKYAIYASHGILTEELADLLLFHSAREGHPITLAEYVEAAKEAEKVDIYYATGDDIERLAKTPSVRAVLDRGHDVLLCPGSVQDEFCFMTMGSYKGSDFLNVASGNLDMGDEGEEARQANEDNADLLDALLENTPGSVSRVIASTRLRSADDAASCITTDGSVTIGMTRFLLARPDRENAPQVRFILEVNAHHGLFAGLQAAFETRDDERVKDYATVLLNQALLAEDIPIDDPLSFNAAMNALIG